MATMNRNVNLEEINSDAFMGIPFLNHQTIVQKIIFWGSVIISILWNILGTFMFHINVNVIILCTLIPLAFGIIFGCNYNQDLSLWKYMLLAILRPTTVYVSKPMEDIVQIKSTTEKLKREALEREKKEEFTAERQRKLLLKLIIGIIAFIFVLGTIIIIILSTNNDVLHHVIDFGNTGGIL